jgi:AcrR family transcriptional regulator
MAQVTAGPEAEKHPLPERRGARRAELVEAAARLFSEHGYHGTSMQHIAEALGLLKGSLYAHVGSKEELLFDVANEGADRFIERGAAALGAHAPASERLRMFLVGHVETAIEHIDASTVFLNEWRYLSNDLRTVIQDKRDRYETMARQIIVDGIASGEFRADADLRFAALLVLSAGNWVYEWYRPGGSLGPTEIGNRFSNIIITGIREENGNRREQP